MNPPVPPLRMRKDDHEQNLMRKVAQGNRAAFEELYCDYHRRLGRFLARLTRNGELVEEVVNDTFWIVWRKAGEFHGTSQVSTWIFGIAYRCTLKSLRQIEGDRRLEPLSMRDDYASAEEPLAAREERSDWLGHGLRLLPAEQRVTLELAYYIGHSIEEISAIMDCPVGTVKARMFHARVKLRNLLPALGGMDQGHESTG